MRKKNEILFKKNVCEIFGERMHRKSKQAFCEWVIKQSQEMQYDSKIEKSLIAKNIVIGNTDKAEIIICAHYDTPPSLSPVIVKHQFLTICCAYPTALIYSLNGLSKLTVKFAPTTITPILLNGLGLLAQAINFGVFAYMLGFLGNANQKNFDDNSSGVLAVLNTMYKLKNLPKDQKEKIAFVLFDNEEKMLLGSMAFAHTHKKEIKNQSIINLDCVGVAKTLNLLYVGRKVPKIVKELQNEILSAETKLNPKIKHSGPLSMSDHISFLKAKEHVCLLAKDKSMYSLVSHIHCKKDNFIDNQNILDIVNILNSYVNNKLYSKKKSLSHDNYEIHL